MIEPLKDHGQELPVPEHKAIGFVNTEEDLNAIVAALNAAGYPDSRIVILSGDDGIELLEQLRDLAFFGDWERAVIDHGINELENEHFSIGVRVKDRVEAVQVAELGTAHGGHSFSYFGAWVTEQLTR